ncbi:DinB family protein [Gordonia shandongensis]|uniref:DinB family protein n=1 Tax=Gordonia shandongensis TaxID=376351 RepID=UPI000408D0DA|nr:DinB family protein [Gordonia shandongensis]
MTIEPESKDWTWVIDTPCVDCGFDPGTLTRAGVADRIAASAAGWETVLSRPGVAERPDPQTWSPLEYACHVRDLYTVMRQRLELMRERQPARFADWDQDAVAVAGDYRGQDPVAVGAALAANAREFADAYRAVPERDWTRRGERGDGRPFTVETLARYAIHDVEHHRVDVGLPARR